MQLTTPKTIRRRRERRRQATAHPGPEAKRPRPAPSTSQDRARRGGGPEDRALYACECGFAWTGEVTASPYCPHCGTPQAW
jgi:hypothetical protein